MQSLGFIGRFFAWWFGELATFLPGFLRSRLNEAGEQLRLLLGETEGRFFNDLGKGPKDIGSVNFDQNNPQKARGLVNRLLRKGRAGGREITLLLEGGKVLRPTVDLPEAAEENLVEVLSFEMDRNTPFKADEVYFDHRIVDRNPTEKRLTVDLAVSLRSEVEQALRVARSWGLRPARISVSEAEQTGRTAPFNLMPMSERRPRGRFVKRLSGFLAVAACVLVAVAVALPLMQKRERLEVVRERLETIRKEAAQTGKLKETLEEMMAEASFVLNQKYEAPTATAILHESTRVLPDDTWLIHLSWRQDTLRLSGYSSQPTALIKLLEDSPYFSDVSFASPVTLDPRLGVERFNIAATTALDDGEDGQSEEAAQ